MKALFVGLGSIGQRHLRNLIELRSDIKLMAFRTFKNVPYLSDKNIPNHNLDICKYYGISEFESYQEALNEDPDIVFICNPSSLHFPSAYEALKSGSKVFIEKPIALDLKEAQELLYLESQFGERKCFVGFQYRFHPVLIKLKEIIQSDLLGNLINCNIINGEYLPYWHPYEDYSNSYAAKKNLGGGAILTQIHDFDYSIWLFGNPNSVYALGGHLSNLNLDVEDSVQVLASFDHKGLLLPVHISLDYLSWPSKRTIKIVGDKGSLECDINLNKISLYLTKSKACQDFNFPHLERNNLFIEEMRSLLNFVEKGVDPNVGIMESIQSLRFALASKESMMKKYPIQLNTN